MAGQFRVWGRFGHLAPVLPGEYSGRRFGWHERDVFVLVDDYSLEQRAVEHAAFSRFTDEVISAEGQAQARAGRERRASLRW